MVMALRPRPGVEMATPGHLRAAGHVARTVRASGPVAVLTAAVMLLTVGCAPGANGSSEPSGAPTSPEAPATTPTDPAMRAEQLALAAYLGMWNAFDQAGRGPQADPADPLLEQYATGDALTTLVNGLESMRSEGLVFEGQVVFAPQVVELTPTAAPTQARIEDCADSSSSAQVRADGQPHEDEPGGFRLIIADVEDSGDGTWKVTGFAVRGVGSCEG